MRLSPVVTLSLFALVTVLSSNRSAAAGGAARAPQGGPAATARSATLAPATKESPLACDVTALNPAERKRHFDELGPRLRSLKTGVRELPDGYELAFPGDAPTYRLLAEWVAGERACCPFFDIDVRSAREAGPVLLTLTGRPGVKRFIEVDGAAWIQE